MERKLAEALVFGSSSINSTLSLIAMAIDEYTPPDGGAGIRIALGEIISDVHLKLTLPAIKMYPDLDPDKNTDFPFVKKESS